MVQLRLATPDDLDSVLPRTGALNAEEGIEVAAAVHAPPAGLSPEGGRAYRRRTGGRSRAASHSRRNADPSTGSYAKWIVEVSI